MDISNLSLPKTDRLLLRPFTFDDVQAIFEIFSDPEVTRFWGHSTLTSRKEAEAFIKKTFDGRNDGSLLQWGIVEKERNQLIGTCAYADCDQEHKRAEIGFALRRDRWNKKYMSEILGKFINFGFEQLSLHRIEADIDPQNTTAIKLVEKFGFEQEGYLYERYRINGEYQDALIYGLLETSWSPVSSKG